MERDGKMKLLRTKMGFISTLWIVSVVQRGQGDWAVSYSTGSGLLETTCTGPDGNAFLSLHGVIRGE